MARIVDPNQNIDPENAAALSGAPRTRGSLRDGTSRGARVPRKSRDKFYVPADSIPAGYVVEWKRKSCLGRPEEPDYQMDLSDAGWKYATPKQFPSLVPEGYEGNTVERGGCVLMIRPKHMKDRARKDDHEEALGQVRDKLNELGMTGQGELPRKVQSLSRSYDRPAGRMIPDDDGEDVGMNQD